MTRRPRGALVAPSLLFAVTLLAGCGDNDADTASSSGSATSTAAAGSATSDPVASSAPGGEGESSDAPPFTANAEPDTQTASADSQVTVTEIRTGRHESYDRVVFEVGGTGTPGWDVRYVDEATSQGSGAPVAVDGQAVLQVTLTGTAYPFDSGVEEWAGPDPLPGNGTQVVTEVVWDATFEGTSVAFVGTSAQAPFRVYALEDPTRIVLEVADAG